LKTSDRKTKLKTAKTLTPEKARGFFRFSSVLFFVLGMVLMLAGQWGLGSLRQKDIPLAPEATSRRIFEYSTVHLDVPEGLLPTTGEPLQSTRWVFEGFTPEKVDTLFASCSLTSAQKEFLTDHKKWQIYAAGVAIHVSPEIILGLNSSAREKVYGILAQSQANPAHAMPFRFSPGLFDGLMASSDLTPAEVQRVKNLTWSNEGAVCFSDLDVLKGTMPATQFKDLIETLYSVPALLMRVRIYPDTDVKALLNYWGKGGRAAQMKPLVESLTKVTNSTRINIEHFLPPFARLHLNTFPNPAVDPMAIRQDCFWSAMNFFNDSPDPQYYDQQSTIRVLKDSYYVTREKPAFGDRIMLKDKNELALHMCVYIADGVVFTKNGADFKAPWVLMKLSDMLALYPSRQGLNLVTYRPKNL
jgi:hypothetical protein